MMIEAVDYNHSAVETTKKSSGTSGSFYGYKSPVSSQCETIFLPWTIIR